MEAMETGSYFGNCPLMRGKTKCTLICISTSEEEKILKAVDILQFFSFGETQGRKNNFLT